MESILIICNFLLGLICLCLILNLKKLNNYLNKMESNKLNDSTKEIHLDEIIVNQELIKKEHERVIEESVVTYPTESQNKFAFKIFKYFSEKNKGIV